MAENSPSTAQGNSAAAAPHGVTHNVSFDAKGGTTIVHIAPGDGVHFHGVNLDNAKIDITGRDVTITNIVTGQKIVIPDLGLYLFSQSDKPDIVFDGKPVSGNDLLSHVGVVNNMTQHDYATFTTLDLNHMGDQAAQIAAAQQAAQAAMAKANTAKAAAAAATASAAATTASAAIQMMAMAAGALPQQNADVSAAPPSPPIDPLLVARQSLLADSEGVPPAPVSTNPPPTPPGSSGAPLNTNISKATADAVFNFTADLLQIGAIDDTKSTQTFYGGNGSAAATLNPSSNVQFSTQIIDLSANNGNLTIYGNNPTYFSANEMTRVVDIKPYLPSGFFVSQVTLSGLPDGYNILGATSLGGGTYLINNPATTSSGAIELTLEYNNAPHTAFSLQMLVTATFNPTSGYPTPAFNDFTLAVTKTVETMPVNSGNDYSFTDGQGNPGWVLATEPNTNKILGGNGNDTIYGGDGGNIIIAGNGNNVMYGGLGNDSITMGSGANMVYASLGNDTLIGGSGTNTINFANATAASNINLTAGTVTGYGNDTISGFHNVIGSNFGDTITGTADGGDTIIGGSGNNYIFANPGHNTINGGVGGSNTLDFSTATGGSNINLMAGTTTGYANDVISNFTTVVGSNFGDTITGTAGNDSITGGSGNNLIYATLGNDTLNGGVGGANTISFINATAAMTVNLSAGTATGWVTDALSNFQNVVASNYGDTITGVAGSVIYGGTGNDSIYGGSNSTVYASLGNDTLDGGTGINTINFSNAQHGLTINLTAGLASGWGNDTLSDFQNIVGSNYGDTITGTMGGANSIVGGSGNNYFYATTGTDTLNGGVGGHNTIDFSGATSGSIINLVTGVVTGYANDVISNFTTILGSNYGDTITGSAGSDSIVGGSGNNYIFATTGHDTINGGIGGSNTLDFSNATAASNINLTTGTTTGWASDTVSNFTTVVGSNHGDTITGSGGDDSIIGGSGNDLFYATSGNDSYSGGGGVDTLSFAGLTSAVTLHIDTGSAVDQSGDTAVFSGVSGFIGSNHGDTIYGSAGNDSVLGGSGNDLFYISAGSDTLNGGGGSNTLNLTIATSASNVDLTAGTTTGFANDSISNFTTIVGSNYGDTLRGSAGNDSITGGSGNNLIYASLGQDTLNGGSGGSNTISFADATAASTINLTTGTSSGWANDTLSNFTTVIGSNFGDTITGSSGNDSIVGGTGNDLIYATAGSDTIQGGAGINTLSFVNATSSVYVDFTTGTITGYATDTFTGIEVLTGSNYGDTINASLANLTINGGSGNDSVISSNNNQLINTGAGNDTVDIWGLTANTTLNGGSGSNTLTLQAGQGWAQNAKTLHIDTGLLTSGADTMSLSNFQIYNFGNSVAADTIYGSAGNDSVLGGSGNNLFYASAGQDTLNGGVGGTNTINFSNETSASTINLTAGTASGWGTDTLSNFANVVGGNYGDTITGTTGANSIIGGSGNDLIFATTGNDTINGGLGTNTISFINATGAVTVNLTTGVASGYGADTLSNIQNILGGNDGNILTGSAAANSITGGTGNDLFYATLGNDTYVGGGGTDTLSYTNLGGAITLHLDTGTATDGSGDVQTFSGITSYVGTNHGDTIYGSTGNDSVLGGSGNDLFYASLGNDTLNGGSGSNTLSFANAGAAETIDIGAGTATGWGNDTFSNFQIIIGSNHGDTIYGSAGSDSVLGGSGNNLFYASLGNDTLNGGVGGTNTINFSNATTASTINLGTGIASGYGNDTLSNFQNVIASNYGDTITGSSGNNSITGGTGNDLFYASAGSDTYVGGGGTDTLSFATDTSAVTLHLDTGRSTDAGGNSTTFSGITSFVGSNHNDTIYGSTGNDSVLGGSGNNLFYASLGNDTLNGGSGGGNTIDFINATAAMTVNLTAGTASGWGTDTLSGFNNVIASNHGDTITGTIGNDSITGGSGNDLIYATAGSDTLNGGGGNNILSFANAAGSVAITLGATGTTTGYATDNFSNFTTIVGSNHGDTITVNDGPFTNIQGGSGNDTITLYASGHTINTGLGNDIVSYGGGGGNTITGGGGTDTLSFYSDGGNWSTYAKTLNIGAGSLSLRGVGNNFSGFSVFNFSASTTNDTIYGSAGNDSVLGGSGNNLFYASLGNDTLNGGVGGTNTINFSNATTASTINLGTGIASGYGNDTLSNFQNVIASNYGDTITGSSGNNSITGGTGNDLFYASAGSDTYVGGGGTDTLSFATDTSAVTLHLDTGRSTDTGGNSTTFSGITSFVGSNHNDTIYGSTGNDSVLGGSGNNLFYASLGNDTLNGGSGGGNTIDFINATAAMTVNLTAGTASGWGTDTLSGFNNVIASNHGDTITGNSGNNSISGGSGSDLFYATTGVDTYTGGGGTDTLSFTNLTTAQLIHLDTGVATDGTNTSNFAGITDFIGTSHGDTIYGGATNQNVQGGSGNNVFYASNANDTLNGGVGGSNTINFSNAANGMTINLTSGLASGWGNDTLSNFTTIVGSNHGDTITGSANNDSITGGSGNNLVYATAGHDTINGGVGGVNTIDFINATSASVINLTTDATSGYAIDTLSNFTKVIGSNYGDTITGSAGNDSITGGTGNDLFYATAGSDTYVGGGGTDTLSFANDTSAVTLHLDTGSSTDGTNTTSFTGVNVFTLGNAANDTIYGSTGNDSVLGGSGSNLFYASTGNDTLNGGAGGTNTIDFINATAAVTVNLTAGTASGWGNDTLSNFANIIGGNHGNTITGTSGTNSITGGSGNDLFYATAGNDTYVGGGGIDTLSYANMGGAITLHLDTGTATDASNDTQSFSAITSFVGSNHNDTIYGSTGNDSVLGGSGSNLFYASTGNDTLNGGSSGTNTISFVNAAASVNVNLSNGTAAGWGADTLSGFNTIIGGSHGDTLTGSTGNDSITGGSGVNLIYATTGHDTLNGGSGTSNTIDFANATAASNINLGAGTVSGYATDTISGFTIVIGSNDGDTITGGATNDSITGGSGSNTIYASLGNDTLNGGSGASNTLNFSNATTGMTINIGATSSASGWGNDTISNFAAFVGTNHGDTFNITNTAGAYTITGGSGNDTFNVSANGDSINTGGGSDIVSFAAGHGDTMTGGGGTDTLSVAASSSWASTAKTVNLNTATQTISDPSRGETDTISGFGNINFANSTANDTFYGSSGNDTITGGSGANLFYASMGSDVLNGGSGTNNTIDFVNATSGVTVNLGSSSATGYGTDSLTNLQNVIGSNHGDTITGSSGNNSITGGTGNDLFYATTGADTYVGGGGTDTLSFTTIGGAITLHLDTGSSSSTSYGSTTFSGIASFVGSNHGDTIYGSTGNDSVLGGSGNNLFYASTGNDTLNGGVGGTNTIDFINATAAVTINLSTNSAAGFGNDTLSNFTHVIGGNYGNTITGSTASDSITGGTGNDLFYATTGNDTYVGGGGTDTLSFANMASAQTIHLDTGSSSDGTNTASFSGITSFVGSNRGDTIYGSTGNDSVLGGSGNNLFYASTGNDTLNGGSGTYNTIDFVNATAAVTVNLTAGTASGWGTDTLSGFNNVIGSNHGDNITGTTGNDSITGGSGNDTIIATTGHDTLNGGGGTNTLSFASATAASVVNLTNGISSGFATDTLSNFTVLIGSNYGDALTGSTSSDSITGGSGNDTIYASLGSDTLNGGGGVNVLNFSTATSASTISLTSGTTTGYATDTISNFTQVVGSNLGDTLTGSTGGSDTITGGSSNDLFYATTGTHNFNGGGGTNTINFAGATGPVTVNLSAGTASGYGTYTLSNIENVTGSNDGDTITGSSIYGSVITCGSGNDLVYVTNGGTNTYTGNGGTNTLDFANAASGSLVYLGSSGTITGWSTGNQTNFQNFIGSNYGDTVWTTTNTVATGGSGNDTFDVQSNTVNINTGLGTDTVNVLSGTGDTLTGGGGGNDLLQVPTGYFSSTALTLHLDSLTISGTGISDSFSGFARYNLGNTANDTIYGSTGNDSVASGAGNDYFYASTGNDTLNGGGGVNTIDFSNATHALTINLGAGSASGWGTDTLSNFTVVVGSNYNDTITGTGGSDSITGGSGNDLFYATTGHDTITGGSGTNTIDFANATSASTINLSAGTTSGFATDSLANITNVIGSNDGDNITGTTNSTITGGSGNDTITAASSGIHVNTGLGNDLVIVGAGSSQVLVGGGGNDTLSFADLNTGVTLHLDTLSDSSSAGSGTFSGFSSYTLGNGSNDNVYGSSGNDSVLGGSGNNIFYGSAGNDTLNGGVGGSNTINYSSLSDSLSVSLTQAGDTVTKSAGTDNLSNIQSFIGSSGVNNFSLDTSALASFTSINGGSSGSNTASFADTATADTNVNSQIASIFSNVDTLNFNGLTLANDAWGTAITDTQMSNLLGANTTLNFTVANGSNLATTLNASLASDPIFTSHTTVGNVTTWNESNGHHLVVTAV